MAALKAIEMILLLLGLWFFLSQIAIPILRGRAIFPILEKSPEDKLLEYAREEELKNKKEQEAVDIIERITRINGVKRLDE